MAPDRNSSAESRRQSGRLQKHTPYMWDSKDGWGRPQTVDPVAVKLEPLYDVPLPSFTTPSPVSPVTISAHISDYALNTHPKEESPPCSLSDPTSSIDEPPEPESPPVASPPKNSHIRRRDPAHIPRPRNAFIFFRSHYIRGGFGAGENQQNELSKDAAKKWRSMSPSEKEPFQKQAEEEKAAHTLKYPNYVYAPGKTKSKVKSKPRKVSTSTGARLAKKKRVSVSHRRRRSRSSATSSVESMSSPEPEYVTPPPRTTRIIREAAQRATVLHKRSQSPSPSPRLSPAADEPVKIEDNTSAYSPSPSVEDDFVPTSEIPVLELSPKEEPKVEPEVEPKFEPVALNPLLDRIPEQFGFKRHITPAAMYASLPTLPRTGTESDDDDDSYNFSAPVPALSVRPPHFPSIHLPAPVHLPHPSEFTFPFHSEPPRPTAEPSYAFESVDSGDEIMDSVDVPENDLVTMGQFFDFEGFAVAD